MNFLVDKLLGDEELWGRRSKEAMIGIDFNICTAEASTKTDLIPDSFTCKIICLELA